MAIGSTSKHVMPQTINAGSTPDWPLRIALGGLLLITLLFIAGLGVIYWGDSYAVPAWDEQSVPAPKLY